MPDSYGASIVLIAIVGMFIYFIYSIGRYDERQKMKREAERWLGKNPTEAEVHQFIESMAGRDRQG